MITELGRSITNTLSGLFSTAVTDEKIEQAIGEICNSLIVSNVNPRYINDLRNELRKELDPRTMPAGFNRARAVQAAVNERLVRLLDPGVEGYKIARGRTNVIVFVGLQGCGKTTSICKYANYHKRRGYKVGIVCADTFRAGAFDQVKQNALKIKVPFFGSPEADPVKVAVEGVKRFAEEGFEVILVDTSGRHTQEQELFSEMKDIMRGVRPDNIVFVMDAGIGQSAEDQAAGFKGAVDVGTIILTKIDGTAKAGGAISSVAATGCPIEFVGTGEGMDDFEVFNARRFVSRMLGMGDIEGLIEKMEALDIDEKEMMSKLKKGSFTLGDFHEQLQKMLSLGPMSKILEMIPGLSGFQMPSEGMFRQLIYIFSSFSRSELDSNGQPFEKEPTRVIRVARGSGTSTQAVVDVLAQFRKMQGMMQKLASIPGMADIMSGDASKLTLSQKTKFKKQARNVLPKDLVEQFGSLL
jgi:signal recognition particle subunit SRP54